MFLLIQINWGTCYRTVDLNKDGLKEQFTNMDLTAVFDACEYTLAEEESGMWNTLVDFTYKDHLPLLDHSLETFFQCALSKVEPVSFNISFKDSTVKFHESVINVFHK